MKSLVLDINGHPGGTLADCRLTVQFDNVDLAEYGCEALLEKARLAGADGIELERCIFYPDGEKRARELERLAGEILFFEEAGYPVAIWTTSLGYGRSMDDPDFLRRFPNYQPLVSPDGATAAVCSTDEANREAIAQNVRDFIRAGAKTILFDDDLVQACRPGVVCVCDEHLRRIAARLGVASVTPDEVRAAYAGAPNPLRAACLDAMGESLMDFCRAMRAAADEVDPSATLATCLSVSQFDLDGVDVPEMVRLLAGKGNRLFVRLSGATYWPRHPGNARNWGQGLGGIVEFLRWQAALLRAEGIVPLDENDPYPRDPDVVPAEMCEAYDRAMIAEGGIVRNKYILRHNGKTGKGIDPAYLDAHLAGRDEAERLSALFKDAEPIGFEIFAPAHFVRDAVLPDPVADKREYLRLCTQPLAGILLAANGAPTRYDRDTGAPLAAFGPAAATLPEAWLSRGVVLDRDGAAILRGRGIDMNAADGAQRIGVWNLFRNARGQAFAVADKGWQELDCREATPDPVPVRDIWRFFTGEEIPVCSEHGNIIAKRRPDGTLAVLKVN